MRKRVTFETIREIGLQLPGVEESTTYGVSSLKLNGKLLACPAINKSAEPNTLMIRIDRDARDALLAEAPDTYYLTDHYAPYPAILVRLSRVGPDALRDLLRAGWQFMSAEARKSKQPQARKKAFKKSGKA